MQHSIKKASNHAGLEDWQHTLSAQYEDQKGFDRKQQDSLLIGDSDLKHQIHIA